MKPKNLRTLGVILCGLAVTAPLTGQQKRAPAQATEQQKLDDRIDALNAEVKALKEKSDRTAMEKDYIERIQKETKDFYDKAFNTEVIIVTIIGLFLAAAGKFGVDHIVQSRLAEATANLQEEFRKEMAAEVQKLKDLNATQVKGLENALTTRIDQADTDLQIKADFQFQFSQGLSMLGDERYLLSVRHFRLALRKYKEGKERQVVKKAAAVRALLNVFLSLEHENAATFLDNAKKELANGLYDGLDDELAQAALQKDSLRPLILERLENPAALAQGATPSATPGPTDTVQNTKPGK